MNKPKTELISGLTLTAAIMITAGSMIGSGIFRKPATMAGQLMSPELLLISLAGCWLNYFYRSFM